MENKTKNWARMIILLLILLGGVYGVWTVTGSPLEQEEIDDSFPFSTEMPPAKQTIIMNLRATQQSALLSPTAPPGAKPIGPIPTLEPASLATPVSTPAGDGFIVDSLFIPPLPQSEFLLANFWYEEIGRKTIVVYAGVDGKDEEQGVIYVSDSVTYAFERFETPTREGWVKVVDAVGEVVILESREGSTLYFNVPGYKYVSTPDEIVPTATPAATRTPDGGSGESYDDAPNYPGQFAGFRPINADLQYYLDYPGDIDWFWFQVFYPGEIAITLSELPEDYRFTVFFQDSQTQVEKIGENLEPGTTSKEFYLEDGSIGEYLVAVFSNNNAYNTTNPYNIELNAPNPLSVIPLLTCVDNSNGDLFEAHFGYENQYGFVRVIPVGAENFFDPEPEDRIQMTIFKPGQVETAFDVEFDGSPIIWNLDGYSIAASSSSPPCGAIEVQIDIKPGSEPNCFNNDGNGIIPVAILSSSIFNASTVDPLTVLLDGQGVQVVGKKGNLQSHLDDVNDDGLDDLVLQIEDIDGIYSEGDSVGVLTGKTYAGVDIFGEDTICIRP